MATSEEHILILTDKFTSVMNGAKKSTDTMRSSFGGLTTLIGGALATAGIVEFARSSIDSFNQSEQAIAQVRAGLESTGGVVGRTIDQLNEQATKLESNSLFSDENIMQNVTAQLITFTSVAGEQFDRAQQSAVDLATRMGGDLQGATLQLGKALNDPKKSLSALTRSGVQFTETQIGVIQKLQETGHLAEAQTMILNEMSKEFGGSAEASAKAGTGGWTVFMNHVDNTKESIGQFLIEISTNLLPVFESMNTSVQNTIKYFQQNGDEFRNIVKEIGELTAVIAVGVTAWKLYEFWIGVTTGTSVIMATATVALTAFHYAQSTGIGVLSSAWAGLNAIMALNPVALIIIGVGLLVAGFILLYNHCDKFRGAVNGVFEVLKVFASKFMDVLTGIGDVIQGNVIGGLSKIKDAFESAGTDSGIAFTKAYKKETSVEGMEVTGGQPFSMLLDKNNNTTTLKKTSTGGGGTEKSGLGSGLSEIKSGAPKIFNINIEKLVEKMIFETSGLTETKNVIKDEITKVLLGAVNDSQIISQ